MIHFFEGNHLHLHPASGQTIYNKSLFCIVLQSQKHRERRIKLKTNNFKIIKIHGQKKENCRNKIFPSVLNCLSVLNISDYRDLGQAYYEFQESWDSYAARSGAIYAGKGHYGWILNHCEYR